MKENNRQITTLRLPPRIHAEMQERAKNLGLSLNGFICHLFEMYKREVRSDDAKRKKA